MNRAEWFALHLECFESEISDAGYLAEIKATVLEILGNRLREDQGREQLRIYLRKRGFSAAAGFPDNPGGSVPGVDLSSFENLKGPVDRFMDRAFAERDKEEEANRSGPPFDFSELLEKELAKHDKAYLEANPGYCFLRGDR